jgi:hypothetical protein
MPQGPGGTVIDPKVTSETAYNNFNPYWKKLARGVKFRGTWHQLKSQEVIVSIRQAGMLLAPPIGTKIIPLREVVDVQFAKTDMIIHDRGKTKARSQADDEDEFDDSAQVCTVQGTVMIGSCPKWR